MFNDFGYQITSSFDIFFKGCHKYKVVLFGVHERFANSPDKS